MKKALLFAAFLAAGISGYAYYNIRTTPFVPEVTTARISRGTIIDTVGATGTLEAVTTVQVGSQVSGTIHVLNADYNSIVHKGDVIARLDPSLFETQIGQARANLVRAEADLERLRVAAEDARAQLRRAEELARKNLISASELEAAQVAVRSAEAQIKSSEAQVTQARASLNQNEVNLQHTVITAPIDGIVISRSVDVGQTVAASMSAPELFVIAADLSEMRVVASIDESDVGRIRPGQRVRFTVDAYPADEFTGTVSQVRLQPVVVQNVVTYATVIDVPNSSLKLKPGMTATVTLEIARRDDAIRIPNAALRFRPGPDVFAALNQPVAPSEIERSAAGASPRNPAAGGMAGVAPGSAGRGTFTADPERQRQLQERLQNMSPEERAQFTEHRRGGAGGRSAFGGLEAAPGAATPADEVVPAVERGARTIDALFGPLPTPESTGRVWVNDGGQLRPVDVRLGITDGTTTELLGVQPPRRGPPGPPAGQGGPSSETAETAPPGVMLEEGVELVTGVTTGPEQPRAQTSGPTPFMPFPGGGFRRGGD